MTKINLSFLSSSIGCLALVGVTLTSCEGESPADSAASDVDDADADLEVDSDISEYALISREVMGDELIVEVYGVRGQPGGTLVVLSDLADHGSLGGQDLSVGERYMLLTGQEAPVELSAASDRTLDEVAQVAYSGADDFVCHGITFNTDWATCRMDRTTNWSATGAKLSGWYASEVCKVGSAGTVRARVKRSGEWRMDTTLGTNKCVNYYDNPVFARTYSTFVEESNATYHAQVYLAF